MFSNTNIPTHMNIPTNDILRATLEADARSKTSSAITYSIKENWDKETSCHAHWFPSDPIEWDKFVNDWTKDCMGSKRVFTGNWAPCFGINNLKGQCGDLRFDFNSSTNDNYRQRKKYKVYLEVDGTYYDQLSEVYKNLNTSTSINAFTNAVTTIGNNQFKDNILPNSPPALSTWDQNKQYLYYEYTSKDLYNTSQPVPVGTYKINQNGEDIGVIKYNLNLYDKSTDMNSLTEYSPNISSDCTGKNYFLLSYYNLTAPVADPKTASDPVGPYAIFLNNSYVCAKVKKWFQKC
jgi:hypothetical protein